MQAFRLSCVRSRGFYNSLCLVATNLEGIFSIEFHRDLGITQKSAWHMAHRLPTALKSGGLFGGPFDVDETYVGGRQRNMRESRRAELGAVGGAHMTAVVGARDRETR